MMPRWCVCPVCTTWVCASHVGEAPWRSCPKCECHLQDYLGGADCADGASSVQSLDRRSLGSNGGFFAFNPNLSVTSLYVDFLGRSAT